MTIRSWRTVTLCLALVAIAGCGVWTPPSTPTEGRPFSRLYVFGDSLSDAGNIRLEFRAVPLAPYSLGRFSNGAVWVQHVARHFGLTVLPSTFGGTNYAHGGSETGAGFADYFAPLGPNILTQVDLFDGRLNGTELVVVWGGANDIFNVLVSGKLTTPQTMADNIALAVGQLYARGGRSFMVPNLPDIGLTPSYRGGSQEMEATALTVAFNAALADWLDQLAGLDEITIYRFDVFTAFNDIRANPPAGITNTTDSAWSGSYLGFAGGGQEADDPDAYLFWDHVHPTRAAHEILAEHAIGLIEADLALKPAAGWMVDLTPGTPFRQQFRRRYVSNLINVLGG